MLNLNEITIETLEKYLISNLWKQDKNFANEKIKLFTKIIDGEEYTVFLPANNNFKDSQRRISDTIEIISYIKEITNEKVISDILKFNSNSLIVNKEIVNKEIVNETCPKDTLSFRIISKLSEEGRIPLEYGFKAIEGLKKLILSTIFNEENPQPYFFRTNKNSHEKLCRYNLAQTGIGSYIFNIEIDINKQEQLIINENSEVETLSEERRIIRRIQNGLYNIIEKDIDTLFEDGYKKGLNANMCDALLNFNIDASDIKIESRVFWYDSMHKPNDIKERVILEKKHFIKVKELSEMYKQTKSIEYDIKGQIIRLNSRKDSKGNSKERNIIIQTEIDGRYKNVKIDLGELDYKKACEAHKQEKDVMISGELVKEGKIWKIIKYNSLSIV